MPCRSERQGVWIIHNDIIEWLLFLHLEILDHIQLRDTQIRYAEDLEALALIGCMEKVLLYDSKRYGFDEIGKLQ